MILQSPKPQKNRLLAALPTEEYDRIVSHLEFVDLELKQILYQPNEPIQHIYFVLDGMVSLLTILQDNIPIEVGTVGNEGMVGLPVFLGADSIPGQAIVQIPGSAMRMETEVFKREVVSGTTLYKLLHRYTQALFNLIAQTAACNRIHSIEERFCRWMLIVHDRVNSDQFPLTQEFLSEMLGVRRAGVNKVAIIAQKAGLIQYSRGKITILDRSGLEVTSCDCYNTIKREFDRLVGGTER